MTSARLGDDDTKAGAGLAKLSLWLVLLAIVLLALIIFLMRNQSIGIRDGFGYISWIVYGGAAVALLALIGLVQAIRYSRSAGIFMATVSLIIALLIVWVPYSNRVALRASPRLSDVTTDMQNPPAFVDIAKIRTAKKARNKTTYGPKKAALQQKHYPDIKPVMLAVPQDQAFKRALAAVNTLRWKVVATDAATGRIEAFETSLIFGFVDDVVIRVAAVGTGSRVDIRSSSRIGRRDAAVNANRVRKLMNALNKP